MTKHSIGMQGQESAKQFLTDKGYVILKENYRLRTSEIDIIARDGDYIVFVEVKFRKGLSHGLPRESVGRVKQIRIIKAAMHYIHATQTNEQDYRFDVVEILESDGKLYANHIENAFWA